MGYATSHLCVAPTCYYCFQIKFLRTCYPDIDIPFALVKDQLAESDELEEHLAIFDPLRGNTLSASYMSVSSGRSVIALSHPFGPLDSELSACFSLKVLAALDRSMV